jgi:glycosyltransferase involved in cell wall biosynthesis
MRIVLDARYLDGTYSGIGTYSRLLVEHLARIDQKSEYWVVVRPEFRGDITAGPNFQFFSYPAKPTSWRTYFRIHKLFESIQPDVVHALSPTAPALYAGPMVVTLHDLQPFTDPDYHGRRPRPVRALFHTGYKLAYPNTLAGARWIVCDSYATRDDAARLFPGIVPKLVVVPPGLDTAHFAPVEPEAVERARLKFTLGSRYLLYYGSTRPNKNLPNLVRAFARVVQDPDEPIEDLTLVLALKRDRFFRDIEKVIAGRGLGPRVRILDQVNRTDQRALLAGATAFCFATKHEGFGFPPLEAMATGVPVLAGDSAALPEVVGDAALLVDPDDPKDIAAAIRRLATDEALRSDLVERGRERAKRFDWNDTASRIHDIYRLLF